jgi:formylglycine-generating enzyme required for sulfatase activity
MKNCRWFIFILLAVGALFACQPADTGGAGTNQELTPTPAPTATLSLAETWLQGPGGPPQFELYSVSWRTILQGRNDNFSGLYSDPGAVIYHDGVFHMFFNTLPDYPPTTVNIGHAVSENGTDWEVVSEVPILLPEDISFATNVVLTSDVLVEEDGTWVLYFYTRDDANSSEPSRVGRATAASADGPWQVDERVLVASGEFAWDAVGIQRPCVLKTEDGYKMFFQAHDEDNKVSFGLATSADGIEWEVYPEPVFTAAETGEEDVSLRYPYVVSVEGGLVLFYRAETRGIQDTSRVNLAVSADGLRWRPLEQPAFEVSRPWDVLWVIKVVQAMDKVFLFMELGREGMTYVNVATYEGPLMLGLDLPDQLLPETILDPLGVEMVLVPGGEFTMGRAGENASMTEHQVNLDNFYIDRYEITNQLFAQFMNALGNQLVGSEEHQVTWYDDSSPDAHITQEDGVWIVEPGYEQIPVNEVTWYGAAAFCDWRGASLPSEAQWEKAARGTDGLLYPWGDELDCDHANYRACGVGEAVAVTEYPLGVSPYGVFNMAGNVAEWTNDFFGWYYYTEGPYENPTGPESGTVMSSRGGSWYSTGTYLQAFYRNCEFHPYDTFGNVGFRCAAFP